jgi:hypothetical protein
MFGAGWFSLRRDLAVYRLIDRLLSEGSSRGGCYRYQVPGRAVLWRLASEGSMEISLVIGKQRGKQTELHYGKNVTCASSWTQLGLLAQRLGSYGWVGNEDRCPAWTSRAVMPHRRGSPEQPQPQAGSLLLRGEWQNLNARSFPKRRASMPAA